MDTTKHKQFWADSSKICYEPTQEELNGVVNPFKINYEMENLSTKIKSIIGTVSTEVNDLSKEYAAERITSAEKKAQLECGLNIAQYRAVHAVKTTFNEILITLKAERINPAVYERIKELFNKEL